jgi:hypothetical protein
MDEMISDFNPKEYVGVEILTSPEESVIKETVYKLKHLGKVFEVSNYKSGCKIRGVLEREKVYELEEFGKKEEIEIKELNSRPKVPFDYVV